MPQRGYDDRRNPVAARVPIWQVFRQPPNTKQQSLPYSTNKVQLYPTRVIKSNKSIQQTALAELPRRFVVLFTFTD